MLIKNKNPNICGTGSKRVNGGQVIISVTMGGEEGEGGGGGEMSLLQILQC